MFKRINFGDIKNTCVCIGPDREKTEAIDEFREIVLKKFGENKLSNGIAELYLILPFENEADYSDAEKKQIAQALRRNLKEKSISSCYIHTIVWVVEYDVSLKKCIDFFPIDRALVKKMKDVEEVLNKNRIVRVK